MTTSTKTRKTADSKTQADPATVEIDTDFEEGFTKFVDNRGRVHVSTIYTIEELEAVLPPAEVARLRLLASEYKAAGRYFLRINATPAGGGVAIMNMVIVALMQAYGLQVEWDVLVSDKVAFIVTKRGLHNPMQGMKNPPPIRQYGRFTRGVLIALLWMLPFIGRWGRFPLVYEGVACTGPVLSRTDQLILKRWSARCWRKRRWALARATDIVIDDWQPSRFILRMRGRNLSAVIFRLARRLRGQGPEFNLFIRDHIHTDAEKMRTPGTPAYVSWRFLWFGNKIYLADKFIVHPLAEFIPPYVPDEMVLMMPATSDLLDGHNRKLTKEEKLGALALLNQYLVESGQEPISLDNIEMLTSLIARFCPAKGMDLGLAAVARSIEIMLEMGYSIDKTPQLIMIGNGAQDDRDGDQVHAEVMSKLATYDGQIARRLRVLRLPHADIIKNVVLLLSKLGLQPSLAEGWENGVTDCMLGDHDMPCVVGTAGGPKEQVVPGESGMVLDPTDTEAWAQFIVKFFTDEELREYMYMRTAYWAQNKNIEYTTGYNLENWLWICLEQARNPNFAGNHRKVHDLILSDERLAA